LAKPDSIRGIAFLVENQQELANRKQNSKHQELPAPLPLVDPEKPLAVSPEFIPPKSELPVPNGEPKLITGVEMPPSLGTT